MIGEVVEVLGKNTYVLNSVIRVQSSTTNWTEFFKYGIRDGNCNYTVWPDGVEISGDFISVPWNHEIPKE